MFLDPIPETCQEEEEDKESDMRGLKSEVSSLEEPRQCDGLGLDDLDAFSIGGLDSISLKFEKCLSMRDPTAPSLLTTEQVLFEERERVPSGASVSAQPLVSADDVEVCVSLSILSRARARALSLWLSAQPLVSSDENVSTSLV